MDYCNYSIIKTHFPPIFNFGIIAILLKSLEYSIIIKNNRNSMCSRGAECTPHLFWTIPDNSISFLIIPDYSCRLQGHHYSDYCRLFLFFLDYPDYSHYSHYSNYCLTMLTTCQNQNYRMLVLPLTDAVAEVSNGDDIPHAQKVLCFPPHDAAKQDAPPLPTRIAINATIARIAIIVSM